MENKYYTPELEEFHVGFEYEIIKYEEIPLVTTSSTFEVLFQHKDYINELRVKYLDKEDIESLGWIKDTKQTNLHWFNYKNYRLMWEFGNVIIWKDGQNMLSKVPTKNKSELKKLMKQLGIYEHSY